MQTQHYSLRRCKANLPLTFSFEFLPELVGKQLQPTLARSPLHFLRRGTKAATGVVTFRPRKAATLLPTLDFLFRRKFWERTLVRHLCGCSRQRQRQN